MTSLWGHVIFFHKQTDVETKVSIPKRRHWHDEVESSLIRRHFIIVYKLGCNIVDQLRS